MATTAEGLVSERRHIPERRAGHRAGQGVRMNAFDWLAMALLIVGGVNWGLVGLFGVDLVATLFGEMSGLSRVVYVAVGLSAIYSIATARKMARR